MSQNIFRSKKSKQNYLRLILLSIVPFFLYDAYSQELFRMQGIFHENSYIHKISVDLAGNSAYIHGVDKDSISIRMRNSEALCLNEIFTGNNINLFTDILIADSNTVYIGTASSGLFVYKNNVLKHVELASTNPPKHINSLAYYKKGGYTEYDEQLVVGTEAGLFKTNYSKEFRKTASTNSYARYIGPYKEIHELDYYETKYSDYNEIERKKYETEGSLSYRHWGGFYIEDTMYKNLHINDMYIKEGYIVYATSEGIRQFTESNTRQNSSLAKTFISDSDVSSLQLFPFPHNKHYSNEKFLFAGTKDGIYYCQDFKSQVASQFEQISFTKGANIRDLAISEIDSMLYCATDSGIICIKVLEWETVNTLNETMGGTRYDCLMKPIVLSPYSNYPTLQCSWYSNNVEIENQNSTHLSVSDTGMYTCIATDGFISDTAIYFIKPDDIINVTINQDTIESCLSSYYNIKNSIYNAQKSFWRTHNSIYNTNVYPIEDYPYYIPQQSHYFKTDTTNWYYLEAENCNGFTAIDSIYIKIKNIPDTPAFRDNSVTNKICDGDTLFLKPTSTKYKINWKNNYTHFSEMNNIPFFVMSSDDEYFPTSVRYSDTLSGCYSILTFEKPEILSLPYYSYSHDDTWRGNTFCEGDSIEISIFTDRANTIQWSDGDEGSHKYIKDLEEYQYSVKGVDGCTAHGFANNLQYYPKNHLYIQHPNYVNPAEIIILEYYNDLRDPIWEDPHLAGNSIIESYQYPFTAYKPGQYDIFFSAKDENNCTLYDTITITISDSIPDGIITHPSPNNGDFVIETAIYFKTMSIALFNIQGKAVYETSIRSEIAIKKIPISINKPLIDGSYLLQVTLDDNYQYQHLISIQKATSF